MGMDDHIQRLYPEDNIGAHSSYLIIRSYPEFTARRLAAARASATPDMVKDKFSAIYTVPDVDKSEKGDSETIGLWMFTTDSREPLFDVFSRLVALFCSLPLAHPSSAYIPTSKRMPPIPRNSDMVPIDRGPRTSLLDT